VRLAIAWSPEAERYLLDWLPRPANERIDRATLLFAERREGTVRHEPPYHYLEVGPYDLRVRIDEDAGTLSVLKIERARPR
jgi:hypothetical protein